ncbi:hypothetical protein [Bdellovibrio reynosensis]|uniref:Restriction endonuclease type IV Mrr domain-containing protein n=1 Tax=Bdellovibrio reynosensis TaxID=2835041 RepID=A0ABY4CAQ9_9BACT|nr:hypothetical protein [Bdellovibrio reynosensis]UOF01864.1 hypothetical protein MNR06_02710 [Bdellovibrio reynosensis]
MKSLILITVFLSSSLARASWEEDFQLLKDFAVSYEASGTICEEIARLDMQEEYPSPQYSVINGIAYGDEERVIGELDVVIFDNNLQAVIKIAEVKCWKDPKAGIEKAHEQRARFIKAIRTGKPLRFFSTSSEEVFPQSQFQNVKEFFSIAQKGTSTFGFERELEYTLLELKNYRFEMIRCQNQGKCAHPFKRK